MRETGIVDLIRKLAAKGPHAKSISLGIGDDCAILQPHSKEELVFTTDLALEGRHFEIETHTAADVGHKALARSLSDLAAMGSEPVFCLVSLALPAAMTSRWIPNFYKGLLALASRYKVTLAGGDLSRFDKIVVDVMCCGRVPKGKAMLRRNARPGDSIYVTGELGSLALGFASRRHRRPEPRIEAGVALRKLGVKAAMDLSDGLSFDLRRLCRESNVSAELTGDLPVARGATLDEALHGGEDYELLFTAPARKKIPARISELPVTRIGSIADGPAGRVRMNGRLLEPKGFDHFA